MTAITTTEALLELHEGRRAKVYRDTLGKLTAGVGRCIDVVPFSDDEIALMFANDLKRAKASCIAMFGYQFEQFTPARQAALVDMCFNLGETGLRAFVGMRGAIASGDWEKAAACALASLWARQVPSRAQMDADMLRTGAWPDHVE